MNNITSREKEIFENAPVFSAIMKLALPSVVGQIILVIYNMADTLFVSLTGSDAMITAVTVCMPAFMFLSAISNLFGVGGASVIARALGKGDEERAKHTYEFAIWGCISVTSIYCLGAYLLLDGFVDVLGGSAPAVHPHAAAYLKIAVIVGGLVTSMNTLFAHLLRARGKALLASAGIAVGGILNIGLDPLFMFLLFPAGNEALAAAAATAISNAFALLFYIVIAVRDRKKTKLSARPDVRMFRDGIPKAVIYVGIPACLMTLCENISYAVLDKLMSFSGIAAQTGIGVAKKINMLAHSIVRGMAHGVLPLIGYNYAAGNRVRMKSVVFLSAALSVGISVACMLPSFFLSNSLVGIFIRAESESRAFGSAFLKILCVGAPFSAFSYSVISFFQATGRGGKSLILALLRKGILDIPLMFLLFELWPVYGIVAATPAADFLCCATAVFLFSVFIKRHGANKYSFIAARQSPDGERTE